MEAGLKAESTWVTRYVLRWFTSPQRVTHPGTNRAWRRLTSLIEHNAVLLHHVTNLNTMNYVWLNGAKMCINFYYTGISHSYIFSKSQQKSYSCENLT